MARYPLQPLLDAGGLSLARAARQLGTSGSSLKRFAAEGMDRDAAERLALRAGLHPYEIFTDMLEHDLTYSDQECAAPECEERFAPRPTKRFCSKRCRWRFNRRERRAS